MTIKQAYKVLKHHADWREGRTVDMVSPTELSKALEIVLAYLENKLTHSTYAGV
jgi:hypothetical protein